MKTERQLIKMFNSDDEESIELALAVYDTLKGTSETLTENYYRAINRYNYKATNRHTYFFNLRIKYMPCSFIWKFF